MELPGIAILLRQDPEAAAKLQGLIQQLQMELDAERWALQRIGRLQGACTRGALLSVLVEETKEQTGFPEVWAVLWLGELEKGNFQAMAGENPVERPERISRSIVAEVARTQKSLWLDAPRSEARFASTESVVEDPVACVPIGTQGALFMAGRAQERRRKRAQYRVEALVRLSLHFLEAPRARVEPEIAGLVGSTPPMQELFASIRSFAPVPWPALVLGETGTGKEAVARALHTLSPRSKAPFVAVNCATLQENLAESLLFGYERGAFTGADRRKEGLLDEVREGTLFLDEVGELPAAVQAKLLRLLEDKQYRRVGGDRELPFTGRLVAATLRPLDKSRDQLGFRSDLYYRLAACVLKVPPLRERREDIAALSNNLLEKACKQLGIEPMRIHPVTLARLEGQEWPGNVRDLENTLRAAVARAFAQRQSLLMPEHLPAGEGAIPLSVEHFEAGLLEATEQFQRKMVREALLRSEDDKVKASEALKVSKQWLYRLLAKWGGKP